MSLRGQRTDQAMTTVMDRYLVAVTGGVAVAFQAETVEGLLTRDEVPVAGAVTVQGQSYAAVDLAARLGLSGDGDTTEMRTILLAHGGRRAAVRVSRVHGLIDVDRQRLVPLPKPFRGAEREWYAGLVLLAEGLAAVLQTKWIVSDEAKVSDNTAVRSHQGSTGYASASILGGVTC